MSNRININSGSPWEEAVGYSRAVRLGNTIEVSGTVASDEKGNVVGEDDPYQQTIYILQKIETALNHAGASLKDVVRTRMFVTNISRFQEFARAHAQVFDSIKPCTTMVEVKALIAPEYLIEIEATAVLY
ncbi:MAG: RidA family protein [Candidatus Dadabacteria bacterium]